jgi:hypothetical protein
MFLSYYDQLQYHISTYAYFSMWAHCFRIPDKRKLWKISVTRRHDMNSGQLKYFCLMNLKWQRNGTFQPNLVRFVGIQINTGILYISSCCNINGFFNLTIECSYDLQEDKSSLPLITLLSGCCDGDDIDLLGSGNFIWMIHDPYVNWICNVKEPTHLQPYTEISLYTHNKLLHVSANLVTTYLAETWRSLLRV